MSSSSSGELNEAALDRSVDPSYVLSILLLSVHVTLRNSGGYEPLFALVAETLLRPCRRMLVADPGAARTHAVDDPLLELQYAARLATQYNLADVAATRGLHFDAVSRVYVLGLPANADTYLHLAGRTGRWPRPERDEGEATVVTIATEAELRTLRGWSNMLGGVDFTPIE